MRAISVKIEIILFIVILFLTISLNCSKGIQISKIGNTSINGLPSEIVKSTPEYETFLKDILEGKINYSKDSVDIPPYPLGGIRGIQNRVEIPWEVDMFDIQGIVNIECVVDDSGKLLSAIIIDSVRSSCDSSAMKAVKETYFIPAIKDNNYRKGSIEVPILFYNNKFTPGYIQFVKYFLILVLVPLLI